MELEATNQLPGHMVEPVHRLIGSLRLRPANVDWYIVLLSYFKGDDEIFHKNYRYVREVEVPLEPTINNSDGLFTNLPLLTEQEIRGSNRMRLPKELNLQTKLAKLDHRQQKMNAYREELEQKLQMNQYR